MNIFSGIILALSLFGFRSNLEPGELVDKKISDYSRILKATNNLTLIGKGRGLKEEKIAIVGADYAICKDVQLDEARLNIVKLTKFYLHNINNDPDLKNLLVNGPFCVTNLELGIAYIKPAGGFSSEVANSFTKEGSVFYSRYNPIKDVLVDFHKETYEEALAIVNGQKSAPE